jgi:hypothetical protein
MTRTIFFDVSAFLQIACLHPKKSRTAEREPPERKTALSTAEYKFIN